MVKLRTAALDSSRSQKHKSAQPGSVKKRKAVKKTLFGRRLPNTKKGKDTGADCEDYCRQLLQKGSSAITCKSVQRALSMAPIAMSSNRKNVIPKGEEAVRGAVCGLFVFKQLIGVASFCRRLPWLTQLLTAFCHKEKPEFRFTSIQVNINYATKPHVDRNNLGTSYIIGLGNYTGGNLWMHTDDGAVPHTLDESLTQEPMYKKGDTYKGREVSIKNRWTKFNGNRLHLTRPFRGTRYSLVYFTCDRYAEAPQKVRQELKGFGFNFQWESEKLQKMLTTKKVERQRIQKLFFKERNSLHQGVVPQLLDEDRLRYGDNPKKVGSLAYKRYKKYSQARNIGEAVKLGALAIDLVFDYNHGFMQVVGIRTRPSDWDIEVTASSSSRAKPETTAISRGESKTVKVRIGEMTSMHKGLDVPRKSLMLLAAAVPKLQKVREEQWAKETSPTASVPLAALRVLLHWAASGRFCCRRGKVKEAVRAALVSWGEHSLAGQVFAERGLESPSKTKVRMRLRPRPTVSKKSNKLTVKSQRSAKKLANAPLHPSDPDEKIRFEQHNPKLESSEAGKRYQKYKKATTVQQAILLGARRADILWDFAKGFLKRRK